MTTDSEQAGLWDRVEDDNGILEAQKTIDFLAKEAKEYARAVAERKRLWKTMEPGTDERIRVGDKIFEESHRTGGGFTIKKWTATGGLKGKVKDVPVEER